MRKMLSWIALFVLGFMTGFFMVGCDSRQGESDVAPITSVSDVNSGTTTE